MLQCPLQIKKSARTVLPALFQAASILHPGTGVGELCAQQLQAAKSLHPGTGVEELCAHQSAGKKKLETSLSLCEAMWGTEDQRGFKRRSTGPKRASMEVHRR